MSMMPPPPPVSPPPPPGMPPNMPPPGYIPYQQQPVAEYASWISRVGAYIIDALIGALFAIPSVIALIAGPKKIDLCPSGGNFEPGDLCRVPNGTSIALTVILGIAGVVAYLVLYCKKVGTTGQSWGHKAVGVRVVDAQTGGTIGTGRAVGRYFGRIISALPCYLGLLWPLWDARKQTFHDKILGTVVVKA